MKRFRFFLSRKNVRGNYYCEEKKSNRAEIKSNRAEVKSNRAETERLCAIRFRLCAIKVFLLAFKKKLVTNIFILAVGNSIGSGG